MIEKIDRKVSVTVFLFISLSEAGLHITFIPKHSQHFYQHKLISLPVWYCQFDVSPVNYSDSDAERPCTAHKHLTEAEVAPCHSFISQVYGAMVALSFCKTTPANGEMIYICDCVINFDKS